jgi:hypothetical protein
MKDSSRAHINVHVASAWPENLRPDVVIDFSNTLVKIADRPSLDCLLDSLEDSSPSQKGKVAHANCYSSYWCLMTEAKREKGLE